MNRVITLDLETTGLPPKDADYNIDYMKFPYIVTMAFKIGSDNVREFIINQEGRPIPPEATAIHGITDEMAAASKYTLLNVIDLFILAAIGTELSVGHNIYFDSSTIKANVLRMMWEKRCSQEVYDKICVILHKDRRIDTMKSTIKFCNLPGKFGAKWPKLTELYFKLFGKEFDAHSSGNDVDACYLCFLELVKLGVIKLPEPIKTV